jgi:hypothetical protein
MPNPVVDGFDKLMKHSVQLSKQQHFGVLAARNWFLEASEELCAAEAEDSFPLLRPAYNIHQGAFDLGLAIQPLRDLGMLLCIAADGSACSEGESGYKIKPPQKATRLISLCDTATGLLNSQRLLEALASIYSAWDEPCDCEIAPSGTELHLKLERYNWTFSVTMGLWVKAKNPLASFYLVPDGTGGWRKSTPKIFKTNLIDFNRFHNNNYFDLVRMFIYWNRRGQIPRLDDRLSNAIVHNYCLLKESKLTEFVDVDFSSLLNFIWENIDGPVIDKMGTLGDVNHLDLEERKSLKEFAFHDKLIAEQARYSEGKGDYKRSTSRWKKVFGPGFTVV